MIDWQLLLQSSALILSVVNGLMLLRNYLRDRPSLVVKELKSQFFNCFFEIPGIDEWGKALKVFGFLIYIRVNNRGLRNVELDTWHLKVRISGKRMMLLTNWLELQPGHIPDAPQVSLGDSGATMMAPVLGINIQGRSKSSTMMVSGGGVSGLSFYSHFTSPNGPTEPLKDDKGMIEAVVTVETVFGNKARRKILLRQMEFEKVQKMIPGLEKVLGLESGEQE